MLKSAPLRWPVVVLLPSVIASFFTIMLGATLAQLEQPKDLQDASTTAVQSLIFDFDHYPTGPVPEGFLPILSGFGESVQWQIRAEPSARSGQKVLAQTSSDEVNFRFPLLLYTNLLVKNVEVGVSFKSLSGKIDQGAGLIVRYQDQDHFYVVRANALEGEVRLYKVIEGVRYAITGANAQVTTDEWHWMKLVAKDAHFQLFFEDALLFEADDTTYSQAGQVGLSTKSDGVTLFDDFYITPRDHQ